MSKYWCKCGRVVNKSTNAATTGNRDTESCTGCPHLLPYGPNVWDKAKNGFVQDVQGYECRMTDHPLDYTTHTSAVGDPNDKTCIRLESLDFDFLEDVTDWVKETYSEGELTGGFDRQEIRGTDYLDGVRVSFYPSQNKKGIAAKQQLFHRFFHPDGTRIDMTPAEEKTKVLADIEKGKAAAQGREKATMKRKEQKEKIISCTQEQIDSILLSITQGCIFAEAFHAVCRAAKDRKAFNVAMLDSEMCNLMFNRDNLYIDKDNTLHCDHDTAGVHFYAGERMSYLPFPAVLDKLWEQAQKYKAFIGETVTGSVQEDLSDDENGRMWRSSNGSLYKVGIWEDGNSGPWYGILVSNDNGQNWWHYKGSPVHGSDVDKPQALLQLSLARIANEKGWFPMKKQDAAKTQQNEKDHAKSQRSTIDHDSYEYGTALGRKETDGAGKQITTLKDLGLSDNCIRYLYDMGFDNEDVDILDSLLPEEEERLRREFPDNWEKIQAYLHSGSTETNDGTSAESSDAENPTPMDDLPWSAAATAAESPVPAALTPTTETAVSANEQADNAAAPVPASSNTPTAFDYSGLDEQTVSVMHMAEQEILQARQTYICRASAAVAMVHEELVRNSDGHNQYSEDTFTSWCRSINLSKSTAYQLLQVDKLLTSSTPEEAAQLEQASPSLLYAAAKPSAPTELVQGVKDGDITTHKQYKALEKQLAEERELRRQAEVGRDAAVKDVRQLEKEQAEDRQWMDSEVEKANQKADLAARKSAEAWEQVDAERKARKQAEEKLASAGAEQEKMERLADDEIARVQRIADDANDRANAAEAKVKELESRPIEVTGADAADIARWRAEGAEQARQEQAGIIAEMQGQVEDAENAQGNVVDALYIMVQQIAANCAAQLDNWSKAAACLKPDAYMDCVQQLDALRIRILQMMMWGTDDDEVS